MLNLLGYIDEKRVVRFCQELIRVPSITGEEARFARVLGKKMEDIGMSVKYVEQVKGRPNVVGSLNGSLGRPVLLMHAHMDTVDAGKPEDWMVDPFKGEIRDGRIYGRGTYDCKGGIAAMVSAVEALVRANVKLKGNVVLLGTVGEENMEACGMPYVMDNYIAPHVKPDMAIYCHPRDELRVSTCFKSLTWWHLRTFGKRAHASEPQKGINSIGKMVKVLKALEEKGLHYEKHPIIGDCTMAFTTISATPNHYNVIPDRCKVGINIRLVPGQTRESVKREIEQLIEELKRDDPNLNAKIEIVRGGNPIEISQDKPLVKIAKEAIAKVTGQPAKIGGEVGMGDLWHVLKHDIPDINLGSGGAGNLHAENEFIEIDHLVTITKIYALVILNICGNEKKLYDIRPQKNRVVR